MFRSINIPKTNTNNEVISRQDVLTWINKTLNFQCRRIEDLASGAAYCLLMDILFPATLSIRKVKVEAKLEHEMLNNYKILQNAFRKIGIEKDIPIMNLMRGRFQDHLLFSQWFKRFYDANSIKLENKPASGDIMSNQREVSFPNHLNIKHNAGNKILENVELNCSKTVSPSFKISPNILEKMSQQPCPLKKAHITPELIGLRSELNKFKEEYEEDQQTIIDLTRERQFYYDKLCNIEILCHEYQDSEFSNLVSKVQEILFKEEDGFQSPSNDDWIGPLSAK